MRRFNLLILIILCVSLVNNCVFAQKYNIDIKKTLQRCTDRIQNGTANVDDYYWVGYINFYHFKDYKKAARYFLKGSELDNKRADVLVGAGMSYVRLRGFEEALKYLKKAQTIDPTMPQAFHQAGECYYYLGKFKLAKKEFERALALTPNDAATCGLYGDTLYFLGDYDNAEKYLLKAIKYGFKPGIYNVYYRLAAVYGKKADIENDIFYMEKCIEANPNFAEAYSDLGVTYYEQKQYNKAIKYLNKAVKIKELPNSYYWLAKVYKDLGGEQKALGYLDKAEELIKYDPLIEWQKVAKSQVKELRKEILLSKNHELTN